VEGIIVAELISPTPSAALLINPGWLLARAEY